MRRKGQQRLRRPCQHHFQAKVCTFLPTNFSRSDSFAEGTIPDGKPQALSKRLPSHVAALLARLEQEEIADAAKAEAEEDSNSDLDDEIRAERKDQRELKPVLTNRNLQARPVSPPVPVQSPLPKNASPPPTPGKLKSPTPPPKTPSKRVSFNVPTEKPIEPARASQEPTASSSTLDSPTIPLTMKSHVVERAAPSLPTNLPIRIVESEEIYSRNDPRSGNRYDFGDEEDDEGEDEEDMYEYSDDEEEEEAMSLDDILRHREMALHYHELQHAIARDNLPPLNPEDDLVSFD